MIQIFDLGREGAYLVKERSDSKIKHTEEDIIKMLEFLVDNIYDILAGKVFQQTIGISICLNIFYFNNMKRNWAKVIKHHECPLPSTYNIQNSS